MSIAKIILGVLPCILMILRNLFSLSLFLVQVPLPSGGILTPRGLQTLGLSGLGSSTGFERLHYM